MDDTSERRHVHTVSIRKLQGKSHLKDEDVDVTVLKWILNVMGTS
jgi:hypothetical protein